MRNKKPSYIYVRYNQGATGTISYISNMTLSEDA